MFRNRTSSSRNSLALSWRESQTDLIGFLHFYERGTWHLDLRESQLIHSYDSHLEKKFRKIYEGDAFKFYRQRWANITIDTSNDHDHLREKVIFIFNNALDLDKGSSDIHSTINYNSIIEYMMLLRMFVESWEMILSITLQSREYKQGFVFKYCCTRWTECSRSGENDRYRHLVFY